MFDKKEEKMYLSTKKDWDVVDVNNLGEKTTLPMGRYKVERITSPIRRPDEPWLVVSKGKYENIGAAESWWLFHTRYDDEYSVSIDY